MKPGEETVKCQELCDSSEASFSTEDGICLCPYTVSCDAECEENRTKTYIKRNSDGILTLKYVDSLRLYL